MWPVKLGGDLPKTRIQTFTQSDREAVTHTDSAYRDEPDQFFTLWSIHADEHGGGISGLVDMRTIIGDLSDQDRNCLRQPYPIRVPTVFSEAVDDDQVEILQVPLLIDTEGKFTVRCSFPNINLALQAGESITTKQQTALDNFKRACNSEYYQLNFKIPSGAILVVNNHELGHSRTKVEDLNRHLIRVRYNSYSSDICSSEELTISFADPGNVPPQLETNI